jgi:hypothetical protein
MPVVLSASSSGCPTQPEYAFYETAPGGTATLFQGFSSQSTYTVLTTSTTPTGSYAFEVEVRDASSTAAFDVQASTNVDLLPELAGDPLTALAQLPGICTRDGWCWQNPTPTGNDFQHITATDQNNVWITGWHLVLQWDGNKWTAHVPPVPAHVQESQSAWAMDTTSPSNTYVIYGPNIDYWNGAQWTLAESGPLNGNPGISNVWIAPDTGDAYVTWSNSTLEQFHNGIKVNTFTASCGCGLYKIWGTSSHDIFITSVGGVMHFDGVSNWTTIATGATLSSYQGSANDVWIGGNGQLGHWDGTNFTMVALPSSLANQVLFPGVYNSSHDIVWYTTNVDFSGQEVIAHWDGTQFATNPVTTADHSSFSSIGRAYINGTWWFGGSGGSLYTSTDGQTQVPVLPFGGNSVQGMWGTHPTNLYYGVGRNVVHWDGANMTGMTTMAAVANQLQMTMCANCESQVGGVTGLAGAGIGSADELYASAWIQITPPGPNTQFQTVAMHYDGVSWTSQVVGPATTDISQTGLGQVHIVGPGEAWAFKANGTSYHYINGSWTSVTTTQTQPLISMWEQDANHVWLVGSTDSGAANRQILTWDAANPGVFTTVQTPGDGCDPQGVDLFGHIFAIGGQPWVPSIDGCQTGSPNVMWKLGANGTWTETVNQILGDGNSFHVNPETSAANPYGGIVRVSDTNVLFSNGGDNGTFRFNGSVWNREDTGSMIATPNVFATASGETLVWNDNGTLIHP